MIDITPIINALILLLAAIITVYVIPLIKEKKLLKWVKIAVAAAEQLYKGSGRGAEKKGYVLEFLAQKGYAVDLASIETMIEAVVQQLNSAAGLKIE